MSQASSVDRYSTWEMDALVSSIDPSFSFLSSTFFSTPKFFNTEFVEHDIVEGGHRVAPFVSPLANGRPSRRTGYRTYQIKPAYIKLTDVVRPQDGFTRLPGEPYGGALDPQTRIDMLVAQQIATHLDMIQNRLELMASDALFTGKIIISGEDYPTSVVDFERNPNNDAVAGTLWTDPNATPLADIKSHADTINTSSRGAVVNSLVMTGTLFDRLTSFSSVRDLVNREKNLSPGTKGIEFGPRSSDKQATYRGQLAGQYDLWTYDGYFEDDSGNRKNVMDQDRVLFVANQGPNSGLEGQRLYGAILDMDAGIQARDAFIKARNQWDPSGVEVLTQCAPMVSMRRPNAVGTLKVK